MITRRSCIFAASGLWAMAVLTFACSMVYEYPAAESERDAVACGDGKDNDLDGKVDCEDFDCSGFGVCPDRDVCTKYCDVVMGACTGPNAPYAQRETCLGVCDRLPKGDANDPFGNTMTCRKHQADLAASTQQPAAYCPSAGPRGAGACGANCDTWCSLLQEMCSNEFRAMPNCKRACSALRDTGTFDAELDPNGDTIQCRLEHVINATASATSPATHCPSAGLTPSQYCIAPLGQPPDCAEFCRFNGAGCSGDFAVYESNRQCLAVCAALARGLNGDRVENTIACRSWHTYNSLIDPVAHCPHTGPGGDGHCGVDKPDNTGNCESYCLLLEKACADGFTASYPSQAACQKGCSNTPPDFGARQDSKYRVATALTANTLACRTLRVARALTDPTECASALGQGSCQ